MTESKKEEASERDPILFIRSFRLSAACGSAFELFFAGKQLSDNITEQEKIEAFERSTAGRDALIDYAQHQMHFAYSPELLTDASRENVKRWKSTSASCAGSIR